MEDILKQVLGGAPFSKPAAQGPAAQGAQVVREREHRQKHKEKRPASRASDRASAPSSTSSWSRRSSVSSTRASETAVSEASAPPAAGPSVHPQYAPRTPPAEPQHAPPISASRPLTAQEEAQAKSELIYRIKLLCANGKLQPAVQVSYATPTNVLASELYRLQNERLLDDGLAMSKQVFLGVVHFFEHMSNRQKLFDLRLKGWGSKMTMDVDEGSYDLPLISIYQKHADRFTKLSPEVQLLLLTIGSAAGYHTANKMVDNMSRPSQGIPQPPPQNYHMYPPPGAQYFAEPEGPPAAAGGNVPRAAGPAAGGVPHVPQRPESVRWTAPPPSQTAPSLDMEEIVRRMKERQAQKMRPPPSTVVTGRSEEFEDIDSSDTQSLSGSSMRSSSSRSSDRSRSHSETESVVSVAVPRPEPKKAAGRGRGAVTVRGRGGRARGRGRGGRRGGKVPAAELVDMGSMLFDEPSPLTGSIQVIPIGELMEQIGGLEQANIQEL